MPSCTAPTRRARRRRREVAAPRYRPGRLSSVGPQQELSLASTVIDTAVRHADGSRVMAVHVRVGHLRQVVPASLLFYFEQAAQGTRCEGARLTLEEVPAQLRCEACGYGWEAQDLLFQCPVCAAVTVEVVEGEEFDVDWISVDESAPPHGP
jgi:hydrogenase nickel incorporation protein HypA/HybF